MAKIGWEVRAGDTISVEVSNDSGSPQVLSSAELALKIKEVAAIASQIQQPGALELVGFSEAPGSPAAIPGTTENDLLIAMVVSHNNQNGGTVSTPSGWTFVVRHSNPGGPSIDTQPIDVFYRVATASEPGTYGPWLNEGLGAGAQWVGIANVGQGNPANLDIKADAANNATDALVVPALDGALWLYIANVKGTPTPADKILENGTLLGESDAAQLHGLWWQGHTGSERAKDFEAASSITFAGIGVSAA